MRSDNVQDRMIGTTLAGRYHLLEQVGIGGMAIVYRAMDINTGHQVAVKLLRPDYAHDADYVTRFQREAEAASKMTHHNIVNLIDVGMDQDNRFLVMEFVSGKTLKQVIQERGRLSYRIATQITIRILSALQHAHENGIIHRDIKPQNILVDNEGHVKVADFGIARMANSVTVTKSEVVMGSVHYFSPEQASGNPADARSDIYSVGVVLYEMLTGRVPFDGDSQVAIAMQHLHSRPVPLQTYAPDIPNALCAVCLKAMAKNPDYRYQTAQEMAADLSLAMTMENRSIGDWGTEGATFRMPMSELEKPATESDDGTPEERKAEREKRKINWPWWIFTTLTVCLIILGMYWGGTSIYERVINSTEVPDLIGLDLMSAEKAATKANLKIEEYPINHPSVAEGMVVMQAPEVGTVLKKGDTVVLAVSNGPASVDTPKLVGQTLQDAMVTAQSRGLSVTVAARVISSDVPTGVVISQNPEPNEKMKAGDAIQVTLSGGLALVPNLSGQTFADARQMLTQAGLTLSDETVFVATSDETLHNLVVGQSPSADSQVTQGTEIVLTIYQVPSLICRRIVTLNLPDTSSVQSVRIGLSREGSEYVVYRGDFPPDSTRTPSVEIFSQEAGLFMLRVYINDQFAYQQEVQME